MEGGRYPDYEHDQLLLATGRYVTSAELDARREQVLRYRYGDDEAGNRETLGPAQQRPPSLPPWAFLYAVAASFALAIAAAIGGAP